MPDEECVWFELRIHSSNRRVFTADGHADEFVNAEGGYLIRGVWPSALWSDTAETEPMPTPPPPGGIYA